MKHLISFNEKCGCGEKEKIDYKDVKNRLKNVYDIDVSDDDIAEYEEVLKGEVDQGELYITNSDFARKYASQMFKKNEETAAANAGNVSGMGAVSTPSPSSTPGQTTGGEGGSAAQSAGDSYGDGGTVGSGDVGTAWQGKKGKKKNGKIYDKTKEFGKKLNNKFKESDYKKGGDKDAHVMPFSEFQQKNNKSK